MKKRKKAKWGKMNIGVGSFVTSKGREMDKTREVESRRIGKEVVGCVQESL